MRGALRGALIPDLQNAFPVTSITTYLLCAWCVRGKERTLMYLGLHADLTLNGVAINDDRYDTTQPTCISRHIYGILP